MKKTGDLNRSIGKTTLFFLTINAVMGTGIFFLPAIGAARAGSGSLLAWIIMSIAAIFISFYFAELMSMFPKSGGVYEYTKNAFGEFWSFIFGWTAWIVANMTIAMLVIGSLNYLLPGQGTFFSMFFSIFFIFLFNFISYRGVDVSTKLLFFFGVMTLFSILAVVATGIPHANAANLGGVFSFPLPVVLLATYLIAETFFGWETMGYLSEEVKDARRIIPKMIIMTTAVISVVSFALVLVAFSTAGAAEFAAQAVPLSYLAERFLGRGVVEVFSIIVFIPLIGTAASWIVSSPRLLFAMSRDRVLPRELADIHKKYRTPYKAIAFQTLATSLITVVALADFFLVLSLLVPLAIFMYAGVMLSVTKLRIDRPDIERQFRAPFARAGPVIVALFLFFLLYVWIVEVSNAASILLLGVMLVVFGAPLYLLIKLQSDEKFTERFFDRISFVWDNVFPLWYGPGEVKLVVGRLKLNENSYVLDFGCGSGITTAAIADKAKKGLVVGVDISEKQIDRAVKRLGKSGSRNVVLIHEHNMRFRKRSFDAVAGVGVLEYLDSPEKTLGKVFSYLKSGGTFSFLSFGKSLGTPAPEHMKNEEAIKNLFKRHGLRVNVRREKKKMAEYWYVWGTKK